MKYKNLEEFKKGLRRVIRNPDIEEFKNLVWYCPLKQFYKYNSAGDLCSGCPLSKTGGPKELVGSLFICLRGSMWGVYLKYDWGVIDKETALAQLVLEDIKLLAYLENKK